MSETETNELREAITKLMDERLINQPLIKDLADDVEPVRAEWTGITNAARTIARFLEWADVLDDLP